MAGVFRFGMTLYCLYHLNDRDIQVLGERGHGFRLGMNISVLNGLAKWNERTSYVQIESIDSR